MSSEKLYLFIHLPKCAGKTVTQSLSQVGRNRCAIISESPDSKLQAWNDLNTDIANRRLARDQVRVVMGHDVYYGMHKFSSRVPFYFTFLRKPVDRYVSHYLHLLACAKNRESPDHKFAVGKLMENGRLLSLSESVDRGLFANIMTGYLAAANQSDLATKRWQRQQKRPVEAAKELLTRMDFIGLVETMPADLEFMCDKLSVRPVTKKINVARTRLGERLDQDLINRIKTISHRDEEIYEFAMECRTTDSEIATRQDGSCPPT